MFGAILFYFVRKMYPDELYGSSLAIWLIIYVVLTNLVIKLIKGKDVEEPKERIKQTTTSDILWTKWKRQKTYEKVIIVLVIILFVTWGLSAITESSSELLGTIGGIVVLIILFVIIYSAVDKAKKRRDKT